jgi:hypothetical protein
MLPNKSKLANICRAAHTKYLEMAASLKQRGYKVDSMELRAYELLPEAYQRAFQNAAYAAIQFVGNLLLPLSGQAYNGYVMQLKEIEGLQSQREWISLSQEEHMCWHEFGLGARTAYQLELNK